MNEPASKPSAVSTGELIDSPKFQKNSLLESLNSPGVTQVNPKRWKYERTRKTLRGLEGW